AQPQRARQLQRHDCGQNRLRPERRVRLGAPNCWVRRTQRTVDCPPSLFSAPRLSTRTLQRYRCSAVCGTDGTATTGVGPRPVVTAAGRCSLCITLRLLTTVEGVFENQLLLAIVFQQHGILIEGPDFSSELDAADQINRDGGFVLPNRVQKGVLNILCRLVLHVPISCFL